MKFPTKSTVVCFLRKGSKVLIVKRSGAVGTYQGKWCGIAGHIENGEQARDAAIREVLEETGLKRSDIVLAREAKPFFVADKKYKVRWKIYPFLFETKRRKISLDWETACTRWISPWEIYKYKTTPRLDETLKRALGWKSQL